MCDVQAEAASAGRLQEFIRSACRPRRAARRYARRVIRHAAAQIGRQLFQAERLASVGQLDAGMAHEINNPREVGRGTRVRATLPLRQA